MLLFSEANQEWRPIPGWVEFLIRLGFDWPGCASGQRKIALISMPGDSAAAGLIALGVLIRDLGNPYATDVAGHYDALLRFARQYLENCRKCRERCDVEVGRCGYSAEATGRVREKGGRLYEISDRTDFRTRRLALRLERKSLTWWPDPEKATDWRIDGEPPVQLNHIEGVLTVHAYQQIVGSAQFISENLSSSYSGLCFAGRTAGETATFKACASIQFRDGNDEYRLPNLLTIHGWAGSNVISRMTFFNSRNEQLDRRASAPAMIVADGDACFLKVLGRSEFQRSDVIGVIHRTMDRDHLEVVGNRMLGLRQWYAEDSETLGQIAHAPRGISISILRKRIP